MKGGHCIGIYKPIDLFRCHHVYLNSVQQMVSGELAGEGLQTGFSRHGLPPHRVGGSLTVGA